MDSSLEEEEEEFVPSIGQEDYRRTYVNFLDEVMEFDLQKIPSEVYLNAYSQCYQEIKNETHEKTIQTGIRLKIKIARFFSGVDDPIWSDACKSKLQVYRKSNLRL